MSDADARRHLAESLLAEEVPAKPSPGEFGSPVAWLLGPDLIAALKQFAVYAMWRGELDLHDWMDASPIVVPDPDGDDWWFDYIADIGDGERAMYTTALLCQDDLWIEGTLARPGGAAALPALGPRPDGWTTLPRGPLLVVGGDTAYPLASTSNLEAHVRAPFTWAYRDLVAAGRLTDDDGVPAREVDVVGIPGNHDYFDLLVGFNRMFRAPVCAEDAAGPRARRPPLRMLGLRRRQDASYFAVRLPWDWQLWGLDPGARGLDYRQESFFRGLGRRDGDGDGDGDGAPAKLIVCQPTPPVAFGRVVADRHALRDLIDLGLPAPFLAADARRVDGHPAPSPAELPRALPDGHCRLDLAGDMHYYARFAAADAPPGAATTGDYACVVSGGGGAFHHPSFTDFGDLPARATFPTPAASRRAVADRLFRPWTVFNGGTVNVAAFLVAVVLCAGSLWSGTRTVTDWLFLALGVRGERGLGGGATAALPPAAWPSLGGAAVFLGSIVAAVILVLAAVRYARWVNRMLHTPRRRWTWTMRALRSLPVDRIFEERGYLPSWLLVLIAAALPPLAPQLADALVGGAPSGAAMLFQAVFLSVLFGLGLALVPFAVGSGGEYHRPTERGVFVVLGVGHTAFQLLLPLVMVRVGVGAPIGLAAALVVEAMLVTVGWHLLRRGGPGARWPALAVWLGHGPLLIAILLLAGHGTLARPSTVAGTIAVVLAAGALGSVLGCVEYGWYLGVASGWNGHNNEAGATSRLERFRQFIRFRLERDRLTGYVIAVDEPGTDPTTVAPRVVDVFTIAPRRAAPPGAPAGAADPDTRTDRSPR